MKFFDIIVCLDVLNYYLYRIVIESIDFVLDDIEFGGLFLFFVVFILLIGCFINGVSRLYCLFLIMFLI